MSTQGMQKQLIQQLLLIKSLLGELKTDVVALTTELYSGDIDAAKTTTAAISGRVMTVGQAILVAVIMLIVLGELYATNIVSNPDNPNVFTNLTTTFGDYGAVAFTMIGLGLIAAGASAALAYFGSFGGGGR